MKSLRLIGLLALTLAIASPAIAREKPTELPSATIKNQKPDVNAALDKWKVAVENQSLADIMKLYGKNALMISTFAQQPMIKREQIEGYFKRVIVNSDIKVIIDETHPRVFGEVAINSGRYTISYTEEGEEISVPVRFTFVYNLQGGKWLIVEQHSSRVPLPDEVK
jgi:uncharacterized protein (TIGR02246 family)